MYIRIVKMALVKTYIEEIVLRQSIFLKLKEGTLHLHCT